MSQKIYNAPEHLYRGDRKKFAQGWQRIFGGKQSKTMHGRLVLVDGKLVPLATVARRLRKRDATQIASENSGCLPRQAAEFNRRFGHMGVKFVQTEPNWCSAVYEDRNAKLRVLKHRGYHDRDEIRG